MSSHDDAGQILVEMWTRIDAQDWDGMAELLDPDLHARFVHSGRVFDADGLVTFNRDYPGRWHAAVEDVVVNGQRAVTRVEVTDGVETYYVASFGTTRAGRIVELVEVWTDVVPQLTA